MKRKKTVTPAVVAANTANSKKSPGPTTDQGKNASKVNAVKHGLTTREMYFSSDEEEREFLVLRDRFRADLQPQGIAQEILVEEIATTWHKLRIALSMETKGLAEQQKCDPDYIHTLFSTQMQFPINSWQLPLGSGWACERLLVRAVSGEGKQATRGWRTPKFGRLPSGALLRTSQGDSQTANSDESHLEINAVLEGALARVTRYQTALKRDLYRAIEVLQTLQAPTRKEKD